MIIGDHWTLEIQQDVHEILSALPEYEPDTTWRYKDQHGHLHRFVKGSVPTVHCVVTATYWCPDCCDEHDEDELQCVKCGDVVEPQYKIVESPERYVTGLKHVTGSMGSGHKEYERVARTLLDGSSVDLTLSLQAKEVRLTGVRCTLLVEDWYGETLQFTATGCEVVA